MIGTIHIHTPAIVHQLDLASLDQLEIYKAAAKLKQWVCCGMEIPFVVYLQIPSKLNQMIVETVDDVPFENSVLPYG